MTLHEAAAVYLIIGSVLLGPIYGSPGKIIEPMMENCGPGMICARHPGETTAETCARAMREIGAENVFLGFAGGRPPEEVRRWMLEGQRVLCIPSPTGLRR